MGVFESGFGLISAAAGWRGKKPKVPEYQRVNLEQEQTSAIKQNLAALPQMSELASKYNAMTAEELSKQIERLFPGTANMQSQLMGVIQSQLRGEIPADVAAQIRRNSAQRAVAGGFSGSSIQQNVTARDLGLTSLGILEQGKGSAMRWSEMARSGSPVMDFGSMFITPAQRINLKAQENAAVFGRNWMANQVKAMPSPKDVAWDQAMQSTGQLFDQYAGMAMSMYGGGFGALGGMAMSSPTQGQRNQALAEYNLSPDGMEDWYNAYGRAQ